MKDPVEQEPIIKPVITPEVVRKIRAQGMRSVIKRFEACRSMLDVDRVRSEVAIEIRKLENGEDVNL